jgi:hypothetical protein
VGRKRETGTRFGGSPVLVDIDNLFEGTWDTGVAETAYSTSSGRRGREYWIRCGWERDWDRGEKQWWVSSERPECGLSKRFGTEEW